MEQDKLDRWAKTRKGNAYKLLLGWVLLIPISILCYNEGGTWPRLADATGIGLLVVTMFVSYVEFCYKKQLEETKD